MNDCPAFPPTWKVGLTQSMRICTGDCAKYARSKANAWPAEAPSTVVTSPANAALPGETVAKLRGVKLLGTVVKVSPCTTASICVPVLSYQEIPTLACRFWFASRKPEQT